MLSLVRLSLKRSKPLLVVMILLYLLALVQLDVFLFMRTAGKETNPLLAIGFLLAVGGYLLGLLGVQFLLIKQFSYEMGNLETLGYRRLQYVFFYTSQFLFICSSAWLISVPVFSVLYGFISDTSMDFVDHFRIHLTSLVFLVPLITVSVFVSGLVHSARDPFMLLKEKS